MSKPEITYSGQTPAHQRRYGMDAGSDRVTEGRPDRAAPQDRPEPIERPLPDRPDPMRRDLAKLLDKLYGLHLRPGHIDAVLDVIRLHAPVKLPADQAASLTALKEELVGAQEDCEWLQRAKNELEAEVTALRAQLAQCYRLTGADPDGNTDAALVPYAVAEVRRLRAEHDAAVGPQWQPIETAGIDDPVLMWTPKERLYEPATITDRPESALDDIRVATRRHWTWATYWMPIPRPPVDTLLRSRVPDQRLGYKQGVGDGQD